jgi:hypothetical protein
LKTIATAPHHRSENWRNSGKISRKFKNDPRIEREKADLQSVQQRTVRVIQVESRNVLPKGKGHSHSEI